MYVAVQRFNMDVDAVLAGRQGQFRTTEVEKEVKLQFDLGNLLATDLNAVDTDALRKRREEYLKELMRDNTQLLINDIWKLPTDKADGIVLAQLPPPSTVLPREKPIPKPKPPTKWELFAKAKGIYKRKRSRMVLDKQTQEWKPRWGYKRVNDMRDDWLIEVSDKADPLEDQFEKRRQEKKERVAKNEYQRLRNIAQNQKGKSKAPLPPPHTKDLGKHELTRALKLAKTATASGGKFTPLLPKEPAPRVEKKRKFAPVVGDSGAERQKNLDILTKLSRQEKKVLDVNKAVNMHIAEEEKRIHHKRKAGGVEGRSKAKRQKTGGKTNTGHKFKGGKSNTKGRKKTNKRKK